MIGDFETTRALVEETLRHAPDYKWTLQGFGMLRTYVGSDKYRLHVWDHRYEVPGAALVHNHPWDFSSLTIAGTLYNTRFSVSNEATGRAYHQVLNRPGTDGGPVERPKRVYLTAKKAEMYQAGDRYEQLWKEIHKTEYETGTVTLIERKRQVADDHALSIWPASESGEWVSAAPRDATYQEVEDIVTTALRKWFE